MAYWEVLGLQPPVEEATRDAEGDRGCGHATSQHPAPSFLAVKSRQVPALNAAGLSSQDNILLTPSAGLSAALMYINPDEYSCKVPALSGDSCVVRSA